MTIVPNQEAEFRGIYLAHCVDERIEVEVGKTLGIFTRYESWKPIFPPGFSAPGQDYPGRNPAGLPFYIRFVGTPGEVGPYGHKGCCRRQVSVREVLELKEVESGIG